MQIEGIVMVRIDDRLIHGQVMTSWLNFLGANKIMIIDEIRLKWRCACVYNSVG